MAENPLQLPLLANNGIKEEAESGLNEHKICIFCPSKIFSTVDTVIQCRNHIFTTCSYCIAVSSKILEQINNTQIETYFCFYCTTNNLDFNEFTSHIKLHYININCICPGEVSERENIEVNIKEEKILPKNCFTQSIQDVCIPNKPILITESMKLQHKCQYCNYQTNHISRLHFHNKKHNTEKKFQCEHCKYNTSVSSSFKKHLIIHAKQKEKDECEDKTPGTTIEDLREQTYSLKEKTFQCDHCNFMGASSYNLKRHVRIHTDERPYHCKFCKYKARDGSNLNSHLKIHMEGRPKREKKYDCDHCEFKTCLLSNLKRHLKIHTGEKPYLCEHCGWKTLDNSNLSNHLRIHTGNKRYKCDYCEFTSMTTNGLKSHLSFHTGEAQSPKEKVFHCDQCGFSTSTSFNLKRHLKKHSGERPYICEFCDFKSIEIANLRRHMRLHTGEPSHIREPINKSHKCNVCEYETTCNSNLKRHSVIHTGEKSFLCEHCGVKFSSNKSLLNHVKKIHPGENLFQCTYCEFQTYTCIDLKTHLKIHMAYKYSIDS